MPYLVLMFVHVGSMFLATAIAVGPILVLVLILRTGDAQTVHRAFGLAEPIARRAASSMASASSSASSRR